MTGRTEASHSLSPASSHSATLAFSHCMRTWPRRGAPPRQALARRKFVRCHSTVIVIDSPRFTSYYTAPLDATVSDAQHSIRVDSVTLPQPQPMPTGSAICKRVQSLIHGSSSRASSTSRISLARHVLCAPWSEEFVSVVIFSTVSFPLRTASWSHKCESRCVSLCPSLFCL